MSMPDRLLVIEEKRQRFPLLSRYENKWIEDEPKTAEISLVPHTTMRVDQIGRISLSRLTRQNGILVEIWPQYQLQVLQNGVDERIEKTTVDQDPEIFVLNEDLPSILFISRHGRKQLTFKFRQDPKEGARVREAIQSPPDLL